MDAFDLFRKLGAGAKFDFKRFGKDAERFKVIYNRTVFIDLIVLYWYGQKPTVEKVMS